MWEIVLISSITFSVIFGLMVILYTFISAKSMRKRQQRMPELIQDLKPGVKVMFAGGFIGTIVSKDENFAMVRLDKNTVVEVAVYSISNIIN